ncbi:MAG: hypothetical protein ACREA3_02205 [Nitrosotalea sp.]
MKSRKINLPDEAIEFISNIMEEKKISLKYAIIEWNKKQEAQKFLKVGDVVKARRERFSDLNGKKGFIGAVVHPCGTGFDLEKSGKFSVYWFEPEGRHFQADLLGFELEPMGESVTREFVIDYNKNMDLRDSMRKELEKAIEEYLI